MDKEEFNRLMRDRHSPQNPVVVEGIVCDLHRDVEMKWEEVRYMPKLQNLGGGIAAGSAPYIAGYTHPGCVRIYTRNYGYSDFSRQDGNIEKNVNPDIERCPNDYDPQRKEIMFLQKTDEGLRLACPLCNATRPFAK